MRQPPRTKNDPSPKCQRLKDPKFILKEKERKSLTWRKNFAQFHIGIAGCKNVKNPLNSQVGISSGKKGRQVREHVYFT